MSDYEKIVQVLMDGGMSEESSIELAFHMTLHYPEHAVILLSPWRV